MENTCLYSWLNSWVNASVKPFYSKIQLVLLLTDYEAFLCGWDRRINIFISSRCMIPFKWRFRVLSLKACSKHIEIGRRISSTANILSLSPTSNPTILDDKSIFIFSTIRLIFDKIRSWNLSQPFPVEIDKYWDPQLLEFLAIYQYGF